MSDIDPRELYRRLQGEASELLGFDNNNLSALQRLHTDLIGCLKMVIDEQQSKQLSGKEADINKLLTAADALQKLLPVDIKSAPPVEGPGHPDSLARLKELVNNRAAQLEYERDDELETLRAENAELKRMLHTPQPAQRALPPPSQEILPPVPEPKTSPSPPTERPSPPLAHHDEPWRPFVGRGDDLNTPLRAGDAWSPPKSW